MASTLEAEVSIPSRARAAVLALRGWERVTLLFFAYLAALATVRQLGFVPPGVLALQALFFGVAATTRPTRLGAAGRVVGDFLPMGAIVTGYWNIGWFATTPMAAWQAAWVSWDRVLLDGWGLRAAIESSGLLLPTLLEVTYLLLYAIPVAAVCVLYLAGWRERVPHFLFLLLLGTFAAYALLPLFPVYGPRIAYAGLDLPHINGWGRGMNGWVLDHFDIPTSVFPSGHVAVAFSTFAGMYRAVPKRPLIWGSFLGIAVVVFIATIYCRYHYTVDGLASITIVAMVWQAARRGGWDA